MPKRVLVTGATGFFGRHLVPSLVEAGYRVRAATRRHAQFDSSVEVVDVGDLDRAPDWAAHLEEVDCVVHLAALAHVTSIIPEADYDRINHLATVRLAKAADAAGARFIFMSSIAAQSGPSSNAVLTEDMAPEPTTAYGRAKLRAEEEIRGSNRNYVIFRPTLTYGEGVIGNMQRIARLATLRLPPPFGAIRNRRSLLAVENMCDAVRFAINSQAAGNQVFILSDPKPVSVAEIVWFLREGAGLKRSGIPVPPALLSAALRMIGRYELWEKLAGNLVTSVAKMEGLGFQWRLNTADGLRALGAIYTAAPARTPAQARGSVSKTKV